MPAHGFEADEALAEGIKIRWLTTIKEIEGGTMTVERMGIDADGRPHADRGVRHAAGRCGGAGARPGHRQLFLRRVPGVEFKPDGTVIVGPDMMTGAPGIFAGGDMVPSERTVTVAVGHGKAAARTIDGCLRGVRHRMLEAPGKVTFAMLQPARLHRRRADAAACAACRHPQ